MDSPLTLVLMAGLSGSGKSTLAAAIAHKMHWPHINKDIFRKVLIERGMSEGEASVLAYELAFATVRTILIEEKLSVILDSSALYKITLENALDIVETVTNVRLKVILCVASQNLRYERLRNRPYQDLAIKIDAETLHDYLGLFEHMPSDKLILSTNDSPEKCLAIAVDYLIS